MSHGMPRGVSLVELLVALTLLEVAAGLGLAATLTAFRLDRIARLRALTDLARRDSVAAARATPSCRLAPVPLVVPLVLPAAPARPSLATAIRCGR